jgi:glycosyltransferase involved in cell wall biosynthesis
MSALVEFWSSVEYGTFLKGLVRELGEDAKQRFAITESEYRQARGMPARLGMRWRCYAGYPLELHRRIRREAAPQSLVVCTNTFYAPWVAIRSARKRGIPVVHWMFDLFPDVLILSGKVRTGSLGERWLRRWVRAMFDGAAANVFLGERLLAYAESKFGPIPRSVVIPVGCDAQPFAAFAPTARPAETPVRVLYCGNFGRMHDVDTLVQVMRGGLPDGLLLNFRGNGAGFLELVRAAGDRPSGVSFGGNLPEAEWLAVMAEADVALVTMKPGAEGIVMPSKTYSAMAAGQAILAVCPRESDLADTVTKHDCGWVIEPGDVAGLRALLESLPQRAAEVLAKRHNSWNAARECYDQKVLAVRWREVLGEVSRVAKP